MKLMPASTAAWMTRIHSSWSLLPQSPNIMAPRHRGLTLTPVAPRLRSCMAPQLVDRCEARLESVASGSQVEAPDAHALLAGKAGGLVDLLVEPSRPVAKRLRVVLAEALDVLHLEARALERERDARQMQRVSVREDIA